MGRIIRLTERDLTRLVKRTITELDRSTYEKAADVAGEKGFNKLSDRFREHGKEFGLGQEKNNITMVVKHLGQEKEIELRMISLKRGSNSLITLETEDLDNGIKRNFEIDKNVDILEFHLMGNHPSLPATRKDAIKVLRFFEDNGFDLDIIVKNIDPRSISYDDAGL
jgi:hypothetical protein